MRQTTPGPQTGSGQSEITHQRPVLGFAAERLAYLLGEMAELLERVRGMQAENAELRARLQQQTDRADQWHAIAVNGGLSRADDPRNNPRTA